MDDNLLTFSQTIDTENGSSFTFKGINCMLLNYDGDVLENSTYDNEQEEDSSLPILMSNGNVLLSIQYRNQSDITIAVFNPDCSLAWDLTFPEYNNAWVYELEGYIYAVCTPLMTSQERYLVKISLDGALVSTKTIETDFSQFLSWVRTTDDNHIMINSTDKSVQGVWNSVFTKIDLEGNTVWEQPITDENPTSSVTGFADLPDGSILVYSSLWTFPNKKLKFFKLSNEGEVIWEKDYGGYNRNQYLIVKVINNDFILLGYNSNAAGDDFEHFGSKDIILQSIDSNGETNWIKSYGIFSDEKLEEIIVDGDDIFVSGERNDKSYAQFFTCKQGEPCDDDNPETMFDEIVEDCLCKGITECESPDFDALVTFYNSLGGDGWTHSGTVDNPDDESNGWMKDCDVCNWYGVTCENDRVTRIFLYENNLMGEIPNEIIELEELNALALERNNISGTLLDEFGMMENLEYLILSYNQISGDIPVTIYNATKLISLDLTWNNITGTLSENLGNLTNLEHFKIDDNEITGEFPSIIGELTKLRYLQFDSNNFTGEIPSEILNLSDLERLSAANNNFTGKIPAELYTLPKLNFLNLGLNNFVDTLPNSIVEATQLFALFLGDNNLYGKVPLEIGNLTNLSTFHLNDNEFTGAIPESIGEFPNMFKLFLNNNDFTGCVPQSMQLLCGNTDVNISGNPNLYTESWDAFCDNDVGICPDVHPDYYPLVSFYNSTNGANWTVKDGWEIGVLDKYSDPCQWYGITCDENDRVSCIDLGGVSDCIDVTDEGNNLTGSISNDINEITYLESLTLSNNSISGVIPNEVYALENLITLKLDNNEFSGEISTEISNLSKAKKINLSNNNFESSLPSSLGQLTNLESLIIENALITGVIPDELGDLESIKLINLSNNNISGSIPGSLANLTQADRITFFNNDLYGCFDPALKALCLNVELSFSQNIQLPWLGEIENFCNGADTFSEQIGAECSDGDPTNGNEEINEYCSCDFIVGTSDLNNSISIFPNPSSSKINLNGLNSGQYSYTIFNMLGEMIESSSLNNNEIYVGGLIEGIYLFQFSNLKDQKTFSKKVVISRN